MPHELALLIPQLHHSRQRRPVFLLPCCSAISMGFPRKGRQEPDQQAAEAEDCLEPEPGDKCDMAITWAIETGVKAHPEWYPGVKLRTGPGWVVKATNYKQVHTALYNKGKAQCPKPCPPGVHRRGTTTLAPETTIAPEPEAQPVNGSEAQDANASVLETTTQELMVKVLKDAGAMTESELRDYISGSWDGMILVPASSQTTLPVPTWPAENATAEPATDEVQNATAAAPEEAQNVTADDDKYGGGGHRNWCCSSTSRIPGSRS